MAVYVNNLEHHLTPVSGAVADKTVSLTVVSGNDMPSGTEFVLLSVSGAPVRFREDGADPSASAGFLIATDQAPQIIALMRYKARKFIRATGTDGVLHVQALRKS